MTERAWRNLAIGMAVVLILLVGAIAWILLAGPGGGGKAAPSGTAFGPTATATATAQISPSASAPPTKSPCCSASPTSGASAGPSPTPGAPVARVILRGFGVDDPAGPQARQRLIVFAGDGPGDVTVELLKASGKIDYCLQPGTLAKPLGGAACLENTRGTLTGHSKAKKSLTWTVIVIGGADGGTPAADLRISWNTSAPRLEISGFRLQGMGAEPYNGLSVQLGKRLTAGTVDLQASWSDPVGGDVHAYRAQALDYDTAAVLGSESGSGDHVHLLAAVAARENVVISLIDPDPIVATEVLGQLVLTWP